MIAQADRVPILLQKDPTYIYLYTFGFLSSLSAIFYITLLPYEFGKFIFLKNINFLEIFSIKELTVKDFVPNVILFVPTAYFLSGLWSLKKIDFKNIFFI
mgnify:CR=1 FL=1